MYKLLAFRMLEEAGVFVAVNTLLAGAIVEDSRIGGIITESRSGREAVMAHSFIDSTGYGDLCAHAGAEFDVPNDYDSCNSFGLPTPPSMMLTAKKRTGSRDLKYGKLRTELAKGKVYFES